MKPEKQENPKSTAGKMAAVAYRWVKQLFNAMMEASARYHEAQAKQPERKAKKGINLTERKASRRQKQSGFDRRSL